MDTLKISYSIWRKHGDNLYCRVRQAGVKPLDINLHTTDRNQAEAFCKLRRSELDLYNSYILSGETVPDDVANKLLRRGTPAMDSRKSGPVVTTVKALDAWQSYLRRIGKRTRTVELYRAEVSRTVPADVPVSSYTRKSLQQYLAKHDGLRPASRKLYSVSLREFVKYCVTEYNLDRALLDGWPRTRIQTEEKGYWTMQQLAKIISCVQCKSPDVEKCYKVYLWFLTVTGCRQGEGGLVEWRDIKDGIVTIRAENTKGNKTRRIPLDYRVLDMIYKLPKKGKLVFADISPIQQGRYAVLKNAIKRAGVPAGGLHIIRHSTSMMAYSKTEDLKGTAEMLGHSPAVALQYYQSARQPEKLRELVDRTFGDEILIPNAMDDLIENGLI